MNGPNNRNFGFLAKGKSSINLNNHHYAQRTHQPRSPIKNCQNPNFQNRVKRSSQMSSRSGTSIASRKFSGKFLGSTRGARNQGNKPLRNVSCIKYPKNNVHNLKRNSNIRQQSNVRNYPNVASFKSHQKSRARFGGISGFYFFELIMIFVLTKGFPKKY